MTIKKRMYDRTGEVVGRLTVIERAGTKQYQSSNKRSMWLCQCACGNKIVTSARNLNEKSVLSCGCLQREAASSANTTHGESRNPLYKVWTEMKQRCLNPSDVNFHHYGGRGIKVCERWRNSFRDFLSDVGKRPVGTSLDRINNDGDYEPSNVRWASASQQLANTRRVRKFEVGGEVLCIREISQKYGIHYNTLIQRLNKGMSPADAISTPISEKHKRSQSSNVATVAISSR